MRLSVQVRLLGGQRWRRSVYVDETKRPIAVVLQDFEPAEASAVLRPTAARIRSLLFVIDTLNARPGTRGTLTLESVGMSRAPADAGGAPIYVLAVRIRYPAPARNRIFAAHAASAAGSTAAVPIATKTVINNQ